MANREQKRAFQRAAAGFKSAMATEWGTWKEYDIYSKVHLGVIPLPGLRRFTANGRYSVQFYDRPCEWGTVTHLMIRPHDCKPVRNWYDLQRIKNELIGEDRVAIEVFPPVNQLVDQANLYHLWVLPPGFELPFGLHK